MKRRVMSAVVLVAVAVAVAVALVGAVRAARGRSESVYTVAAAQVGLAHQPRLWVGRTILVRGRLIILECAGSCPGAAAVLSDLTNPSRRLHVTWTAVNPLLAVLLDAPVASPLIRRRIGGIGLYRVRLVRQTFASSPRNLPQYFPYTNRLVTATDDSAVLVDGLR